MLYRKVKVSRLTIFMDLDLSTCTVQLTMSRNPGQEWIVIVLCHVQVEIQLFFTVFKIIHPYGGKALYSSDVLMLCDSGACCHTMG